MPNIHVFSDAGAVERAAAQMFVERAQDAVAARGVFTVALAGGSTPRRLYSLLAEEQDLFRRALPWERIHFLWGDERHVPPDHADSNYRMANEAMLSRVPIPPENVHRIKAELSDAGQAAREYTQELLGCVAPGPRNFPRLDLILLGMGGDGHTASLFPGSAALLEREQLVVANWVEKFNSYRITATAPLLNSGACVMFLVQGEEKAKPLREVLLGERNPTLYPSQLIQPVDGECHWLLDSPAAALVQDGR